ncbi:cGMP-dependent 3',5'-cyclic phosphodiesterase isoform X1 [Hydra vulgaris]|uniref:cGMP-dependent 3',5'-cyclic phosphodiesterase isoform X1 n=2 Tax=Hydra vulgaris TaxID=6087 RepID=UPI001F5F3222|nr:cGMP-dependent 3',5'-cyclic phosphodiesterase-like [Hydra vulgaris]XP_012562424.2 cGMP-dependent 3',5'-cyclic phosphodiesterase-like [Hydra vulgaris]XP_012562430.2 cGMP-dependent 3',5'-cyclic phosphodiesterase-like [Hydra vulgaris]XP_012562436.2 cGMP-dependent 3',5'-cyclic phosphodiesterase-like [Hydra vulgaris]XP_012562440.2 cGMP-dependent 3',5'-cyclic phosphodiesterase-like [Hydra vulgaris]XP_047126288.1 cGMP-dependent 3',5'-cyclic phosphodiesterase-like [Hydra vulgaris]
MNPGALFTKDIAELSRRLIDKLTKEIVAESGVVLLINKDNDELSSACFGNKHCVDEEYTTELSKSAFNEWFNHPKAFYFALTPHSPIAVEFKNLQVFYNIDFQIKNVLVAPCFKEPDKELIAFFCLFNKLGTSSFSMPDIEFVLNFIENCKFILCNALDWKCQEVIQRQSKALLEISKNLFSNLDDISTLLNKIMEEARNLTKAERCSLFLVDHDNFELVAKVFDGIKTETPEVRIPINQGIAGHVACTGEMLNIKDAYSHPLFYPDVDAMTGFKTKHILCFPIRSVKDKIIGVAELCNKINGNSFTKFDEERTNAFAIFVGLSLVQSLLYKKATDAQQRSKLANELMLHHMRAPAIEVDKYLNGPLPTKNSVHPQLDNFSFMPRIELAQHDSVQVVVAMFVDLDLIQKLKIHLSTLVRFILTVRRAYRDVPYHNWTHAWTVAHFAYLLLKTAHAKEYFSDLESFVLLISCLCHDIDHRGTSSSFQVSSHSVLASLYSSAGSILERHHFAQAMCIIQTDSTNIFETFSEEGYKRALDLMKVMIIATDIANHFKISSQINKLVKCGIDKADKKHCEMILSLCMTTADLSDQTKPWESTFGVSDLLYAEFFAQGDQEKSLGYNPIEMMDRDKASVPDLQYGFLNKIALPIYELLANIFPESSCILLCIRENMNRWKELNTLRKEFSV